MWLTVVVVETLTGGASGATKAGAKATGTTATGIAAERARPVATVAVFVVVAVITTATVWVKAGLITVSERILVVVEDLLTVASVVDGCTLAVASVVDAD